MYADKPKLFKSKLKLLVELTLTIS